MWKFHLERGGPSVGESKKAHLVHVDELRFRAQAEGGPEVLFDGGDEESRRGPSPMQGALLATMGCTHPTSYGFCAKSAFRSPLWKSTRRRNARNNDPRVLTKIHLHYRLRGNDLEESAVKRAIDLSSEKYCSVGIMLRRAGVEFVNTHEILPME